MKLEAQVEALPSEPGVYLFKGANGRVLYVGKAQKLKSRVRQYLAGSDGRPRVPALMERVEDVDVLVTATVKDALLLENELIKRHKPPFNVRLRDDKQYLGLRLDPSEEWPRVTSVRRRRRDGAWYFGPYTSSVALKEVLSNLHRIFPLRSCRDAVFRDYRRRGRPCIEYEMKRCVAPCVDLAEADHYRNLVEGTRLFLRGRGEDLIRELRAGMEEASAAEEFEEAARLRNRIAAVEATVEEQQIVSGAGGDRDVFGLAREGGEAEMQVLHVRDGRVVGAEGFAFSNVKLGDADVMSSFLGQYYGGGGDREIPRELLLSSVPDDGDGIETGLAEKAGRGVKLRRPERGSPRRLMELAARNADLALARRLAAKESVEALLEEIREACSLSETPRRIECYDVSNFQGSLAVASRVVFQDGEPRKSEYRKYRIREAMGGDDYDCLREVLRRRVSRVKSQPLPDLLMVDGGRGQVAVAEAVFRDAGLEVELMGIAKERDNESPGSRVRRSGGLKAERLYRPGRSNPILLPASSRGLLLLQRVRDESHRFAISFQRQLRSKLGLASVLEEIPGIGPGKRRALLKHLGSMQAVRGADAETLAAVPGLSRRDAEILRLFFDAAEAPSPEG
ncbi:MAG: excinuclease ABC subunit UvrC [Myxococcota bacterium]|nr:excinuclease ABC subunit UvrC [Myxococcota bacterium]